MEQGVGQGTVSAVSPQLLDTLYLEFSKSKVNLNAL